MRVEYDKYGVLREKKDAEKINTSLGYCPECKELVWRDGNVQAVNLRVVKHRVCPTPQRGNKEEL